MRPLLLQAYAPELEMKLAGTNVSYTSDSLTVTQKVSVYPLQFFPDLHLTELL